MTRKRTLLVTTLMCLGVAVAACDKGNERANQDNNPNNPSNVNQNDNRRGMTNPQDRAHDNTADNTDNRGPDQAQKQQITAQVDQQKKDYHAKVDAELKDIDARMDGMKNTVDKMSKSPTKQEDQKLLDDLSDRRSALKSDLDKIDGAQETEWPAIKSKVDEDLTAFRTSLRQASTKIHVPGQTANPSGVTNPQPGTNAPSTHPYDTQHKHDDTNR